MEIQVKDRDTSVLRGEEFLKGIKRYAGSKSGKRISASLNVRRHTLKDADTTYRVINHWEQVGLIDDPRPRGKGWRRYSTMDIVWLYVIGELRRFGLPLETIRRARESLVEQFMYDATDDSVTTFFEFYIALAFDKVPVFLLVFRDGTVEPTDYARYEASLRAVSLANHVQICLNPVVQTLYPKADLEPVFDRDGAVTDEELELLFLLRTGNYDSLTVKYRNGEIEMLEAEETVTDKRIVDLLNEEDYQDVMIKRRDGKTVSIKRTLKRKLS